MEYVYSALVLHSAGKDITEEGVANILNAAGIEADESRIKALTACLDEVDIQKAIEEGIAMPTGGAPSVPEAEEEAEEEEEEEEEERDEEKEKEEAAAGLGSLF